MMTPESSCITCEATYNAMAVTDSAWPTESDAGGRMRCQSSKHPPGARSVTLAVKTALRFLCDGLSDHFFPNLSTFEASAMFTSLE